MKILYLTAFPPNRKTAGQNFSRHLLTYLSEKNELDLFYFNYKDHVTEIEQSLIKNIKLKNNTITKVFNIITTPFFHPFFTSRFNWFFLYKLIKIKDNYDLIIFDFSQVHLYGNFINHKNKLLICHDVILQKYSRSKGILENLYIKFTEYLILKKAKTIYTFSKKDSDYIKLKYNLKSSSTNFFLDEKILKMRKTRFQIENYFCMYGAWNRFENYDGLEWFIKKVYLNLNQINIKIIGPNMPKSLIEKLNNFKNIEYIGFVEDPYEIISKSKALIAPLFSGAGVKVKVIESLALGVDVIGTEIAFEGIECYNKDLECHSAEEFIEIINKYNFNDKSEIRYKNKNDFISNYVKNNLVYELKKILC